jgi:hypothetical protein
MKVNIGPYLDDMYDHNGEPVDRLEQVIIHDFDTWSMDHTLALIALPMLKQLKETKHGVPYVDYEDMPEHLQFIPKQYSQTYELFPEDDMWEPEFERQEQVWDWIMDEMIWAMDQLANENDVDPEVWYSKEFNDRMSNALKLFGKYYRSLWD